jgi:hypothetical protein
MSQPRKIVSEFSAVITLIVWYDLVDMEVTEFGLQGFS